MVWSADSAINRRRFRPPSYLVRWARENAVALKGTVLLWLATVRSAGNVGLQQRSVPSWSRKTKVRNRQSVGPAVHLDAGIPPSNAPVKVQRVPSSTVRAIPWIVRPT